MFIHSTLSITKVIILLILGQGRYLHRLLTSQLRQDHSFYFIAKKKQQKKRV